MYKFERCDYCGLLLQHIGILQNELTQSEPETDNRYATILESKSYYWLVKVFYNKDLVQCDCEYKIRFCSILKDLLELFENEVKLDADKMKCDICRILPCELFSLLDVACKDF